MFVLLAALRQKTTYSFNRTGRNIVGIFQAGLCYQKGRGVEKDIEKAIEYYKKGMEHGDVQCAHNLGSIYLDRKRSKGSI